MGLLGVVLGLRIVLPVLISSMAAVMVGSASYNFIAQKSCSSDVPKDINGFICRNLTILDQVNDITTTTTSIMSACSALGSTVFGFMRDVKGESKPLMFIGVIAEFITAGVYFISAVYWSSSPWISPLTRTFVSGGFGDTIMQLGATCLLMKESTPEELPMRMQVFMTASLSLRLVGGTLTTMVLTTFGYRWLFVVCIGLHVIAFLLVIILVKEKKNSMNKLRDSLAGLRNIFKWRENLIVLWLLLFVGPITLAIFSAESANDPLYFQIKLNFSMYQLSTYEAYRLLVAIIGTMVVPFILRKMFHCEHLTIGIIASGMNCVGAIAIAYVETQLSLYLFTLITFMRLVTLPLPNTIISTIVNHDETGTYLGFAAIVTVWVPYGMSKLYRLVFSKNEEGWVGAYYLLSAGFFILLAVAYSVSYCLYDKPKKNEEETNGSEKLDQNIENGNNSSQNKNEL